MEIKDNIEKISEKIEKVAAKSGRKPNEITLLAASKTRTPQEIKEAYLAGIKIFGENKIQEAREKIPFLSELPIKWHMIGYLQKNKAKYAVKLFKTIQSIDSEELLKEIEKRAVKENKTMDILIEVKLSPEETKHGIFPEKLPFLIEKVFEAEHLKLKGFMTIPPYMKNPENVRPYFIKLRKTKEEMETKFSTYFQHLSMGMTHDFEIAIEEGATIVRIGTAIFGRRNY